jgi:hypothetical protein
VRKERRPRVEDHSRKFPIFYEIFGVFFNRRSSGVSGPFWRPSPSLRSNTPEVTLSPPWAGRSPPTKIGIASIINYLRVLKGGN